MEFLVEAGFWWFFMHELLKLGAAFIAGCIATHGLNIWRGAA